MLSFLDIGFEPGRAGLSLTRAVHGSVHREDVARHNAAFFEGLCAAIDELRALGEHGAADRLEAALFVRREAAE